MNMQDTLQQELTPADLLAIDHKTTVKTLTSRAPELVEQLHATPDALIALAKQIEALEPLPLVPELPTETPYPTEALLGMDGAVFEISDRLKVSPALVGQCALGLANGIIQGLADIVKPANPNPKPTSLFLLAGAESGEGKTLVDDILSSRLHDLSIEKDLSYQAKREEYELCLKAYHCEVKKIENQKDVDQADREQAFRDLAKPVPPMNPRLKASDVTIEGLARQYREGCTRLSLMTDEGALLLCKLWDGGQWDIDRGAQENNFSLIGRRLSTSISTQPAILREIMGDSLAVNQGFIPRFLVAMPDSRIHERQMINIQWGSLPAIREYWQKLSELYDIAPATRADHPLILNPRKLTLTAEATRLYEAYGNQCFKKAAGQLAPVRAMAMKAEDNLLRIAATLTLWNDHSAGAINSESVEAAAHLMDYYLTEGLRIADFSKAIASDGNLANAAELLAWANMKGKWFTCSALIQQSCPNRFRDKVLIKKLMNILVEHGHVVRLEDDLVVGDKQRKNTWLFTS